MNAMRTVGDSLLSPLRKAAWHLWSETEYGHILQLHILPWVCTLETFTQASKEIITRVYTTADSSCKGNCLH